MKHSGIETLLADYRDLRGAQRREVDAHVSSCKACARLLAQYQAMDVDLQGLRDARPDPALRAAYYSAVRDQASAVTTGAARGRRAPWLYGFAAGAAVLVMAVAVWGLLRPDGSGRGRPRSQGAIPAAKSAEVGGFIWQTDGAYGYEMLRPASWTMAGLGPLRGYFGPNTAQGAALELQVAALMSYPSYKPDKDGLGEMVAHFDLSPNLDAWAGSVEEVLAKHGVPFERVAEVRDAVVYRVEFENTSPSRVSFVALIVREVQPLILVLNAYDQVVTLESLRSAGLWDDLLTMIDTVRPIPVDANRVEPGEPTAPQVTPAPTPEPVSMPQAGGDLLPPANGLTHTWPDYERALVRAILPATLANGVCEWQVLGAGKREVYAWAFCAANQANAGITASSVPAAFSVSGDGHTITARIPRDGTYYSDDVRTLFPDGLQQRVFDGLSTETLARLEQHARRRLTLPTLPPLGAAETIRPRPEISATGVHIDLYSGRSDNPRWELNELDLEQLDALLEGLPVVDCPPMPDQLGYRGVVVGLGMADESRMTAYGGTLWFGYAGANPKATCLADNGRSVERFLLGSAQPYLDPQVWETVTTGLALPLPTPLGTPAMTPPAPTR